MNSLSDVWKTVLDRLKKQLSDTTINTWFDEVTVVTMEDSALVLHCGNVFKKSTIEKRFVPQIKEALRDIFSSDLEVKLLDDEQLAAYHGVRPDHPDTLADSEAFTFETYVVGPQNKMAYAAARSVAEKPAGSFNPLFIYGDSGLGKTHLLHAIARQTRRLRPESSIVLVKGVDFTNELIEAIRGGTTSEFRDKYQKESLLLVDDIQFIAGKQQTQEEFFHTFNALYESGKQIVLTSDRPPHEMVRLEDRLRTRFEWGLLADIQPPDFETRIAILKRKAQLLQITLPEDVCEYIASRLKNNIRELEGCVKKMRAYYLLENQAPSFITAQKAIADILNNDQPAPVTVSKIVEEVSRTFNVSPEDIRSKKRSSSISRARQISIYCVREITQMSVVDIGDEFGGRDHSTVIYALQQIEKLMQQDAKVRASVEDIIKNIRGR